MTTLIDTKFVDVKFEEGVLKLEVPAKVIALAVIKPALEGLKSKLPDFGDAIVDRIVKEIEEL